MGCIPRLLAVGMFFIGDSMDRPIWVAASLLFTLMCIADNLEELKDK